MHHTPDCDNIAKGVLDAAKTGFYLDDAIIYELRVSKAYGTQHGMFISLTEMDWVNGCE